MQGSIWKEIRRMGEWERVHTKRVSCRKGGCKRNRVPPPAALGRLKRAATTTTPNPYPFLFFSFALGARSRGGPAARPSVPVGARDGAAPGPGAGKDRTYAVCHTADHGGPPGRVQARRSARASATSAGDRPDPHGQGERGRARECPRTNWPGAAAQRAATLLVSVWGKHAWSDAGAERMLLFGHGMTRAPMPHRGDVVPCGWWSGAGAGDVTEAPGPARRVPGPVLLHFVEWAGKANRNFNVTPLRKTPTGRVSPAAKSNHFRSDNRPLSDRRSPRRLSRGTKPVRGPESVGGVMQAR